MEFIHVEGVNRGKIRIFTLSTCVWCKKTKRLLSELGVEYSYVDVDLLKDEEKKMAEEEIRKWNPYVTFPTLILNEKECIIGYKENRLKEVFG
jgi:glutaredoxin